MKKLIIILCIICVGNITSLSQDSICKTCLEFKFTLKDNMLKGSSRQFAGQVIINLPAGFTADSLITGYLFSAVRDHKVYGKMVIPGLDSTEIKLLLLPYRDTVTVFMQNPTGLWPWDKIQIKNDTLILSCDIMYSPPPGYIDLEIIDLCLSYLKDSTCWNRNDDRFLVRNIDKVCDDDKANNNWCLYCALQSAFIEKMGYFNYRGAALQQTRIVINELLPGKAYRHPLTDFNNDPDTDFNDLINVLHLARARMEAEIHDPD